jgi:hypothetical protein
MKRAAPSRLVHEREGLEHVRSELPDFAPSHAWTNFEFVGSTAHRTRSTSSSAV